MHPEDTIAAISTPPGHSGIGIVRLTGPDAVTIADKIFRSAGKKKIRHSRSHRIMYGHITEPETGEAVDEVLLTVMKAPNTYTREDIVEINCHGGAVPIRRVLELLLKKGARPAEPGEFTRRAFLNGRIDLAQAEAVLDVINSLTAESQKTAVQQLRGGLSKKLEAIQENMIGLTVLVEAHIDFPEEDIGALSLKEIKKRAETIKRSLKKLIKSSRYGMILREGLRTAIIGRPNVGKSSLLNALIEHDRAIVTELPGTTRDMIEEYLNIQGLPVKIIDTAGIREVGNIAEKEGVRRSLALMEEADLVLLLLDGSEALHDTDRELITKSTSSNTILVINKSDLRQKLDLLKSPGAKRKTVRISAKQKRGLETLKDAILERVAGRQTRPGTDVVTNVRHVHALERSLESINAFLAGIDKKSSPEFLAVELRDALDATGEILGITTSDDILDRIFSSFCIGK